MNHSTFGIHDKYNKLLFISFLNLVSNFNYGIFTTVNHFYTFGIRHRCLIHPIKNISNNKNQDSIFMNSQIKIFLQYSAVVACFSITSLCHADINQVIALINTPSAAPVIRRCEGNINCNAFVAISKQWQLIPKNDRLRYFIYSGDLNALIREGK